MRSVQTHVDLEHVRTLQRLLRGTKHGRFATILLAYPIPGEVDCALVDVVKEFRLNPYRMVVLFDSRQPKSRPCLYRLTEDGISAMQLVCASDDDLADDVQREVRYEVATKMMAGSGKEAQENIGNTTHDGSQVIVLPRGWQSWRFREENAWSDTERRQVCWLLGRGGMTYRAMDADMAARHYDRAEDDARFWSLDFTLLTSTPTIALPPRMDERRTDRAAAWWWSDEDAVWPCDVDDSMATLTLMREHILVRFTACVEVARDALMEKTNAAITEMDADIARLRLA